MTIQLNRSNALTTPGAPDATRWPDLVRTPRGFRAAVSARVAERIFRRATRRLGIVVQNDDEAAAGRGPTIVLRRPAEFFARVGSDGLIGFGEAWQSGAWESPDVGELLTVLCRDLTTLVPSWMQRLRSAYVARPPRDHVNEVGNTHSNISHHYDLSNDLFSLFLDPTLSYSSALFDDDWSLPAQDLAEAQRRKIDRILDQAGVGAGTRLLEIGTGWGELAIRAAQRGAEVVTVTLSREQQQLARTRIDEAGCTDLVRVDLCDYREVEGSYDAVVSVEMIEAVGHEYWATYFATIDRLLAPGGRVVIQAITMPHDRMLATRRTWTWINKYIFPGGFLPSVQVLDDVTRVHTTLRIVDTLPFGLHYAETLRRWEDEFTGRADEVRELGFDDTFLRTWKFYLAYSRAGFAAGYLDVRQLTFTREEG